MLLSLLSFDTKYPATPIHFVQAWEQHLLSHDAAFIFTDTYQGKNVFTALSSQTPSSFAVEFAVRTFAPGMLVPADHLESTIIAMLAFWDDRASNWKSKYPNREAARRDLKACMPTDQGHELYGSELKEAPAAHQLGQGILIPQRLVRNPPDDTEKEHGNTVFLLPLLPRVEGSSLFLRHKLLGLRRCHANCFHTPPALTQSKIEDFRRSCSRGVTKVAWGLNDSQHMIIDVEYNDPVDGAA